MKNLCALCSATVSVTCDHCNAPLIATNTVGNNWLLGAAMVCLNGITPVVYTNVAIAKMETVYAYCQNCAALPVENRERHLAKVRETNTAVPEDDRLIQNTARLGEHRAHEIETRHARRSNPRPPMLLQLQERQDQKKRGPTGVPKSATTRAKREPELDDPERGGKP